MITKMCMDISDGKGSELIQEAGLKDEDLTTAEVIVWGRLPNGVGTLGSDAKKTCVMLLAKANDKPIVVEIGLDQLELVVRGMRAADEGEAERRDAKH